MGRYKINVSPDLDRSLVLKDWDAACNYLRKGIDLVLEIGSGLGEFLADEAIKKPETLFIGLEWDKKRVLKSTEYVWRSNLNNLRFMNYCVGVDVREKLKGFYFREIHINHPDPWEKRKQRKRRIIRDEMLKVFYELLSPKGILWVATDHEEYSREIKNFLISSSLFELEGNDYLGPEEIALLNRSRSRFEKKLESKGFPSRLFKANKSSES